MALLLHFLDDIFAVVFGKEGFKEDPDPEAVNGEKSTVKEEPG